MELTSISVNAPTRNAPTTTTSPPPVTTEQNENNSPPAAVAATTEGQQGQQPITATPTTPTAEQPRHAFPPAFAPLSSSSFAFGNTASTFGTSPSVPVFGATASSATGPAAFRSSSSIFNAPQGFNQPGSPNLPPNFPLRSSTLNIFNDPSTASLFANTALPSPTASPASPVALPPDASPPFSSGGFRFASSPPSTAPIASSPPVNAGGFPPNTGTFGSAPNFNQLFVNPNLAATVPALALSPSTFSSFNYNRSPTMFPPVGSSAPLFNPPAGGFVFNSQTRIPMPTTTAPTTASTNAPSTLSTSSTLAPPAVVAPPVSPSATTTPAPHFPSTYPHGSLFAAAASFISNTTLSTTSTTAAPSPAATSFSASSSSQTTSTSPPTPPAPAAPPLSAPTTGVPTMRNIWTKPVYPLEGARAVQYGIVKHTIGTNTHILSLNLFQLFSTASDIIALLRTLFELPEWKERLTQFVVASLAYLPNLLDEYNQDNTISDKKWLQRMHTIVAIFLVFGIFSSQLFGAGT